jgi:hypothetical protein
MQSLFWLLAVALPVACAFVAATMAARKHRSPAAFFVLGLVTSIVGVIIARFVPAKAPAGSRLVSCPRCSAVTNVPDGCTEFECRQCKLQSPVLQPHPSLLALDETRYTYAKYAMIVLLIAIAAVFVSIQTG